MDSSGTTTIDSAADSASPAESSSPLQSAGRNRSELTARRADKGLGALQVEINEAVAAQKAHAAYPLPVRLALIEQAKPMLFAGARLIDVAKTLGVPSRTLDFWLAGLGDEYRQLRRAWIDGKLVDCEEELLRAPNKLEVQRWDRLTKIAQWWAERRDPERYAPKQEITHVQDEPKSPEQVRARIKELESRLGLKTIDAEAVEIALETTKT